MNAIRRLCSRTRELVSRRAWAWAWLVGLILRLLTAIFAGGFFARDDYFHVLLPALNWLEDPHFHWDSSGLPGAGIRSHLLPRLTQGALWLGRYMGMEDPEHRLTLVYGLLAVYASLLIPAVYALCRHMLPHRPRVAQWATWLSALHIVPVYAGTRLLIEALAMPPLLGGMALLLYATRRTGPTKPDGPARKSELASFAGGLCFALAFWWRFQVGFALAGFALFLMWQAVGMGERDSPTPLTRHRWLVRIVLLTGGFLLGMVGQGVFDLWSTGRPFAPLLGNIAVNLCAAADLEPVARGWSCILVARDNLPVNPDLSRSGLFSYMGLWLLLSIPPLTLLLVPALWRSGRESAAVVAPWLVFVLAHSAIGHKEERFMLPVLPLFFIWAAVALDRLQAGQGLPQRLVRLQRLWPAARYFALALLVLSSGLTPSVESQLASRQALAAIDQQTDIGSMVSVGPELPLFYLRRKISSAQVGRPDRRWWKQHVVDSGRPVDALLAFAVDEEETLGLAQSAGLRCTNRKRFMPAWPDRLVFALNPKRNRRRSTVLLWRCRPLEESDQAQGGPLNQAG